MNITFFEHGQENSETIVFLHGLGVSSWMWTDQIESLKDRYHCVAIDLPGNGESYQLPWHSFADTARQVSELIKSVAKDGVAHVVGLSLGGYVALQLIANHPDRVLSMITSGVTPEPLVRPMFISPLSNLTAFMLKFKWMAKLSARMMQLPEDVVPLYEKDMARLSSQSIKRIYQEVLALHLPKINPADAERMLVVCGDKEASAVINGLDTFVTQLPAVTMAVAPQAHHGWNGEHPELFSKMIEQWIKDRSLPNKLNLHSASSHNDRTKMREKV